MYLTTEKELLDIISPKLVETLLKRFPYRNAEFAQFVLARVEEQMIKRFNKKRYFDSQKHAFRYVSLIVFKQAPKLWYDKHRTETTIQEQSYFTGERNDSSSSTKNSVAYSCSDDSKYSYTQGLSVDAAVEYAKPFLQEHFGDITDHYLECVVNGEKANKHLFHRKKKMMDTLFRAKIAEYSKQ